MLSRQKLKCTVRPIQMNCFTPWTSHKQLNLLSCKSSQHFMKKKFIRKIPFIFLWISLFLCILHTLSFFLTATFSFTYVVFCLTTREGNYYYFIEQILAKYLCFCLHSNLNCFCCSWKAKLDVGLMEYLWSGVNSTRLI